MPRPRRLTGLLEAAAARHAARPALCFDSRRLTYKDLFQESRRLAALLQRGGIRPGQRVALHLRKGPEAFISLWGALLAGAAYVPIDPLAPVNRVRRLLEDCGATALVSDRPDARGFLSRRLRFAVSTVLAEAPRLAAWSSRPDAESFKPPSASAGDLAYILYTSGSTGSPKGVMMTHGNALAFVDWARGRFPLRAADRVANLTALHFDLSVFDVFNTCAAGAALYPLAPEEQLFPARVADFLRRNRISVLYTVPSALTALSTRGGLAPRALNDLRYSLFAGEVFPPKHLAAWMDRAPRARHFNLYGPTETNVCTFHEVKRRPDPAGAPAPIGRPLPGTRVLVMDRGRPAARNSPGELWVSGPTVMQGYAGRPARFVRRGGARFYRTGDVVLRGSDGALRWIARLDAQVKSRGYRVEPGEIEACLTRYRGVIEAAVVAVPDEAVTHRLVAVVAAKDRGTRFAGRLAEHCALWLPRYMVPERFIFQETLPKTSTGKLDRAALLEQVRS